MKKTGDYLSWMLLALVIQTIFFLLSKTKLEPVHLINFISFAGFFVLYRFALDWNYWNNSVQKFLKKLVIRKDVLHQAVFALTATLLLVAANKNLSFDMVMALMAFTSVLAGSTLIELIRLACNKLREKIHAYKFIHLNFEEGKNEKKFNATIA